jgi:hypothetical protein
MTYCLVFENNVASVSHYEVSVGLSKTKCSCLLIDDTFGQIKQRSLWYYTLAHIIAVVTTISNISTTTTSHPFLEYLCYFFKYSYCSHLRSNAFELTKAVKLTEKWKQHLYLTCLNCSDYFNHLVLTETIT